MNMPMSRMFTMQAFSHLSQGVMELVCTDDSYCTGDIYTDAIYTVYCIGDIVLILCTGHCVY